MGRAARESTVLVADPRAASKMVGKSLRLNLLDAIEVRMVD
jgi:hypothetical protein